MEPVRGFLGRYLRRRLYALELRTQTVQTALAAVLAWLPGVWQHINKFLEAHSSSDVTIGPRLFLACPLDVHDAQAWFTNVWNYTLWPYLVDAVQEGVKVFGRRGGAWVDPTEYIRETYPWPVASLSLTGSNGSGLNANGSTSAFPQLLRINAEDVGLEGGLGGNMGLNQDPLVSEIDDKIKFL